MIPIACPNCKAEGTIDQFKIIGHSIRCMCCAHQAKLAWAKVTIDGQGVMAPDIPDEWVRRTPEAIT